MKKGTKKGAFLILVMLLCGLCMVGCSKKEGVVDPKATMEFKDFLVERCVREELGKDWDEDVTYGEVAEITSLTISSIYNPSIVLDYSMGGAHYLEGDAHTAYIDLADLEYLTNLEELTVNAYINCDSIVNVDAIANCKKLKELRVPCNLGNPSSKGVNALGYKYWADIIAELPELEYMDLGMYVDEHMKEVMLSKTDNKDITFYEGETVTKGDMEIPAYMTSFMSTFAGVGRSMLYTIDASDYNSAWKDTFKGYYTLAESYWTNMEYASGVKGEFPMLEGSQEEIIEQLKQLDADTEDIIIKLRDLSFDFSVLDRFENLVTLSVICPVFDRQQEVSFDPVTMETIYEDPVWRGAEPVNLDSLTELENLQTLCINGFIGDLSDIADCKNLREVTITKCIPDSVDFIGELTGVKELVLCILTDKTGDEAADVYNTLDEMVCSLSNLKYYRDQNRIDYTQYDCYEDIENMSSLETLYLDWSKSLKIANVMKGSAIKNLYIQNGVDRMEGKCSFADMKNLEFFRMISVNGHSEIDYEEAVELPNLHTFILPTNAFQYIDEIFTPELGEMIASHEKLSAFTVYPEKAIVNQYYQGADRNYLRDLYEAGVYDGIVSHWIMCSWDRNQQYTYDDFLEQYGSN